MGCPGVMAPPAPGMVALGIDVHDVPDAFVTFVHDLVAFVSFVQLVPEAFVTFVHVILELPATDAETLRLDRLF